MKHFIFFIILVTSISCFAFDPGPIHTPQDSYQLADKELNIVYQRILNEYQTDTLFIENLKASQRIWVTFRDAELKVKYPESEPGYYGSIYPVCVSNYLEGLTRERIKTLKIWLEGIEEGDVCAGSVRRKE
jgi:uncharacterized protein YecT (DUF1311 family)